jgi:hypothetical protein
MVLAEKLFFFDNALSEYAAGGDLPLLFFVVVVVLASIFEGLV